MKATINLTLSCTEGLPGVSNDLKSHMVAVVREALASCSLIYGIEEAIKWGSDFRWTSDVFTRDTQLAEDSSFDLTRMVRSWQHQRASQRLSLPRVNAWLQPSDPDYDRLCDLATTGMRVFLSPNFSCNSEPPPQRKLYLQVSKAVNKILFESWKEGLVFILPRRVAQRIQPLHYSPVHWTTKVGKQCGRNLFDSSDDKYSACLNSDEAKLQLEQYYGVIEHPTIKDICNMITQYTNSIPNNEHNHIVVWKADLKGAFTLLNFRPEDVKYLACELTDDLVLLYHTGLFGWTGTPYAFQVVTRVIKRLLRTHISSHIEMYVDDIVGVCLGREFESIRSQVIRICEGLLGPGAVAPDKWDHGRCIDVLGWNINLDSQRVSIAKRNFLKVVCGFFNPNITSLATIHDLERLASWSARYTTILRHAIPLTTVLYKEFKGFHNRNVSKKVSDEGRNAIFIWRYLLCMLKFDHSTYSRSLQSFSYTEPTYKISFDSSLTGIGVGIYRVGDNSLLRVTSYAFPFSLVEESRYQNSVEFIAIVVGMWMLRGLNVRDCNLCLEGDSITALTWASTERFRGSLNSGAVVAFIMLGIHFNLWISDSAHIAGVDNVIFDALSRGKSCLDLGFNSEQIVDLAADEAFNKLILLCNPRNDYSIGDSLVQLWKQVWSIIQ